MTSTLRTLQTLIHDSSLKKEEQKEFLEMLSAFPEAYQKIMIGLFNSAPDWVEKLYKNYKAKKKALASMDKKAWQKIVDQEVNDLKELDKK